MTSQVPDQVREQVSSSLAGALQASQVTGGDDGSALVVAAKDAWMSGFGFSALVAAVVVAVAGGLAWRFLPDQAADHDPGAPAPRASGAGDDTAAPTVEAELRS